MRRFLPQVVVCALLILASAATPLGRAGEVPTPEKHLGHALAADFKLVPWDAVRAYFGKVAAASNRVRLQEIGPSSEGRAMIMAVVAAPDTIAQLEQHRQTQHKLADPRLLKPGEKAQLTSTGKVVVLISCSIHAEEAMATQTAMQLLYDLAAGDSPRVREILEKAIVLLVPSANPDGVDKVAQWYERSLGKPWEGSGMPWLYHKYAGHDNNRDWFMLNFAETRNITKVLYQQWFPQVVLDLHQMSSTGPRQFLPPHYHPLNKNIPGMLGESMTIVGGSLGADLARAGKTGVSHSVTYDLWWAGGFSHEPHKHNVVAILSETASCRVATPLFITKDQLKGAARGLPNYAESVNFFDPWPGGWWRPRDIVEYQRTVALGTLTLAARFHDMFLANYVQMGEDAVSGLRAAPPVAWLVPAEQQDPGTMLVMLRALADTGVEIHRADAPFTADGVPYPAGTYIMYCAQPYRDHLNDMMEVQEYPQRTGPNGKPEQPYDTAGWTLPFQMGVRRVAVVTPFSARATRLESVPTAQSEVVGDARPAAYLVRAAANDDFRLVNRLQAKEIAFSMVTQPATQSEPPLGSLVIPAGEQFQAARPALLDGLALRLVGLGKADLGKLSPLAKRAAAPRVGLYQPWTASMDEGWTRLVLEQFGFRFTSVHNAEVIAGRLRERYDCLVLPSVSTKTILEGLPADSTEPQYTDGISMEGLRALQEFVEEGGSLVCIDESCNLPIRRFSLPVRNALHDPKTDQPLESDEFFCPGSIVAATLDPRHPLAYGKPRNLFAYFAGSQAFDVVGERERDDRAVGRKVSARVVARYADGNVLQSGYLLGEKHVAGKAAVVDVTYGQGHIVLFGFRVQHRGQAHGTYRLLFNAIQASVMSR